MNELTTSLKDKRLLKPVIVLICCYTCAKSVKYDTDLASPSDRLECENISTPSKHVKSDNYRMLTGLTVMCTAHGERILISIRCQTDCVESKFDGQTDTCSDYSAKLLVVQRNKLS